MPPSTPVRERVVVATLLFVCSVVSIVSSLGAPLIPSVADELGASLSSAQWSLTATMLVGAVAAPIVGRLGDGRHRRTIVLACLATVLAGCVLAALADGLELLVAGRALQGVGLALVPLTMAGARDALEPAHAQRTIGTLSVMVAVGVGLGYPITGLIADHLDVAAAFWAGAGMTALALALAAAAFPPPSEATPRRRLDTVGAGLLAAGLVALLIGIEQAPDWGWGSAPTVALVAVASALLTAWGRWERRVDDPLVDVGLLRHRTVLGANAAALSLGTAMYLLVALLTTFAQLPPHGGAGLGQSVFAAGLALVPLSVGMFGASRFLPAAEGRVGQRPIVPAGALVIGLGAAFFAVTTTATWQVFATFAIVGIGLGFSFAALPVMIVRTVPPHETGSATGFYQVARYVGFAIGSGLSITLVRSLEDAGATPLAAFRWSFAVAAGLCALTAALAWALPGPDRAPARREPDAAGPLPGAAP